MLYLNFKNWPIIDLVNKLYIISNKILQKRKAVIHTEEKCTHGSVLGMLSLATPDCVLTDCERQQLSRGPLDYVQEILCIIVLK